jgi:protein ImuB
VTRTIALWFPDWPVYAVATVRGWDLLAPAAVVADHRVHAANAAARRSGVRTGMKRRQALAACPALQVGEVDETAEAAAHEEVLTALEQVAAGIDTLRPGLLAFSAGSLTRYHGSEERATELLVDAAARAGADCLAGAADDLATAVWAARHGRVVAPGGSGRWLAGQPLGILVSEPALGAPAAMVDILSDLGVRTLADFAALPRRDVIGRFGQSAADWHRTACGEPERTVAPVHSGEAPAARVEPEEPVADTGTAAFLARRAAAELHGQLARAGRSCLRLSVRATLAPPPDYDGPLTVERLWRCREPLTEEDTAQRVRWQLDGWLTRLRSRAGRSGVDDGDVSADGTGICAIDLVPVETVPAGEVVEALWGGPDEGIRAARAAAARAQALIGTRAVLRPVHRGGRSVAGRVVGVPYGEEDPEQIQAQSTRDWEGELPAPLPGLLGSPAGPAATDTPRANHPAAGVRLLGEDGAPVAVTGRGLVTCPPSTLVWGGRDRAVTGWAGPWPVDEQWWSARGHRYARLQVATDEPAAYLLVCRGSVWRIEGTY